MKFKLLAIIAIFSVACAFAQINTPINTTLGEVYKDKIKMADMEHMAPDGQGGFVILKSYRKRLSFGYYITHLDENLNIKSEKEIKASKNVRFKGLLVKNHLVYLIQYLKNGKYNEYNILAAPIETLTFTKENSLFKVAKKDMNDPIRFYLGLSDPSQVDFDPSGDVEISENGQYIKFIIDIKDKKAATVLVKVFDTNFNEVFTQKIVDTAKDKDFDFQSSSINQYNGTVYFLGKSYDKEENEKRNEDSKYFFKLFMANKEGVKKTSFLADEPYINAMEVVSNKNILKVVGFFTNKKSNRIDGVVSFDMNPVSLAINSSNFQTFDETFMKEKINADDDITDKKLERKIKSKAKPYTYKALYLSDAGELVFLAEEDYMTHTIVSSTNMSGSRTISYQHYNDIISCKIAADGSLAWAKIIHKSQISMGPHELFLSFTSVLKDDKVLFFVNGPLEDLRKTKNDNLFIGKPVSRYNFSLYVIAIDDSGAVSYEKLIDGTDSNIVFKVQDGKTNTLLDNLLIEGANKKQKQFLKIAF